MRLAAKADLDIGGADPQRRVAFAIGGEPDVWDASPGDDRALELVEAHDAIVRGCLATWGGREVKHTGDGIMASFTSPSAAVRCGREIQLALARREEGQGVDPLAVRIGAAAGEPVERNQDLFGSTVQLAARLCALAAPGEVLVSAVLSDLCLGQGMGFDELGDATLKGFPDPVRIRREPSQRRWQCLNLRPEP